MQAFTLEFHAVDPTTLILSTSGDMNMESAEALRKELTARVQGGGRTFLVDATKMEAIDSPAVSVLFSLLKLLSPVSGSVCIFGANLHVRKMLDLVQITRYVSIYASQEEALRALAAR